MKKASAKEASKIPMATSMARFVPEDIVEPLRRAFAERGIRAVTNLAKTLSSTALSVAAGAPSDDAALATALSAPETVEALARDDPLAEARLRGIEARRRLLDAEGGTMGVEVVAKRLGLSRQAVDKRRLAGTLLALHVGKRGYLYPSWQFDDRAGGLLHGLHRVLAALADHDAWMQLAFLLNKNLRLGGGSPLAALRAGRVDEVVAAAEAYGEQGSS